MVARFHTDAVLMVGIDVHDLDGLPTPCAVAKPFSAWPNNSKTRPKLTGHGHPMVQEGFKTYVVPHAAIIPPQTPKGLADLAWANAESSSICVFGVASVTSGGEPLACSVADDFGANANCCSLGPLSLKALTGITASAFPLLTNPTDEDLARACVTLALEAIFGTAFKAASKKLVSTEWLQKLLKNIVLPKVIREPRTLPVVDTELR